jgi:cell division protein FtsI/penicillin-binding protein 2
MSSATGNRTPRAGAHRAPKTGPSPRRLRGDDGADGEGKAGGWRVRLRSRSGRGGEPREPKPGGLRSKSTRRRVIALGAVAVVVLAIFFHGGGTSPEPTVAKFLLDWETGQYQQAAALTTGPQAVVASELQSAYKQVNANSLALRMTSISQQGGTATAGFRASVDLATGLQWKYANSLALREKGQNWLISWTPSVIVPGLQADERLALVNLPAGRDQINAASGQPLTVPSTVYEIGVYPGQLKGGQIRATADELASVLQQPQDTAINLAGQMGSSLTTHSYFQELFTLTPAAYHAVAKQLHAITGVIVRTATKRLFDSIAPDVVGEVGTETAPMLQEEGVPYRPGTTVGESGLQQYFQYVEPRLTGSPGTAIVILRDDGTAVSEKLLQRGQQGKPVQTTINYNAQLAANSAVDQAAGSAALVAVQAGTGKILAVASHQAAGMPKLDPLGGQYEPGQAFTMVSAAMFLAGGLTPNTILPCPPSNSVNGHTFYNQPAEPPLRETTRFAKDFAIGCSTALAGASQKMTAANLVKAADEFGIGAPWKLPLAANAYFSGTIGPRTNISEVGLAGDTIGRGDVRVSPLAMALAAATVESGKWVAPSLVTGIPDPKTAVKATMSPAVLSELQQLMRNEVAHGRGSAAGGGESLYGQAGVAPFGPHGKMFISWFVGYQGTTAFAVAELVKSPSDVAVPLAGGFLRNSQAG